MSNAMDAVSYLVESDDIDGAVSIAMGRSTSSNLSEDATPQRKQKQVFFISDQDMLNRFLLIIKQHKPDVKTTQTHYDAGGASGYAVTVSGTFGDGDIASMAGSVGKGQIWRLDNPPGSLRSSLM